MLARGRTRLCVQHVWETVRASVEVYGQEDVAELVVAQAGQELLGEVKLQRALEALQFLDQGVARELGDGSQRSLL